MQGYQSNEGFQALLETFPLPALTNLPNFVYCNVPPLRKEFIVFNVTSLLESLDNMQHVLLHKQLICTGNESCITPDPIIQ